MTHSPPNNTYSNNTYENKKKDHPRARADTREDPPPTKPERTDDERRVPSDLRVVALREKLHSVGVLITPTIIDSYMAFAEDDLFDFEHVLRGITAAAANNKQHHFKYVAACIRNLASENSPPASRVNFSIEDIVPELYGDQHGHTG